MILPPFFEIHYGDRLAKNVKSQCVQIIPRSTDDDTLTCKHYTHHTSSYKDITKYKNETLCWLPDPIHHIFKAKQNSLLSVIPSF